MNTTERPGQLPRRSTAALNRRWKLIQEAEAAGQVVIEAAQAWVAAWVSAADDAPTTDALVAAVRDLNARVAKVESAK
jgi:hypothetical protein